MDIEQFNTVPQPILTPVQRVRVFISSTLEELKEERNAVRNAIEEIKLTPIYFEAGARPYPPRELYRAYLEQSHLYVGIFWNSYGFVQTGMDISGIEDEYNLSHRKPRLVYIKETTEKRHEKLEQLISRIKEEASICFKSFSSVQELTELVKNDLMQLLSERFMLSTMPLRPDIPIINELDSLSSDIKKKKALKRQIVIESIKKNLEECNRLLLTGNPGIGKTFIIGQYGNEYNGIYVSLLNKSTQQICSYLANHLTKRRNGIVQNLPSESEALFALQQELTAANSLILIDDIDQNTETASALMKMDYSECKVIFASRARPTFIPSEIKTLEIGSLSHPEVEKYIEINKMSIQQGEAEDILEASNGNPLFLYYCSQYNILPLPKGLLEYHDRLWEELTDIQREIAIFISLSIHDLQKTDIHEFINFKTQITNTMMETKRILETSVPIIQEVNDHFAFFHSYFREYILERIISPDLARYYHNLIGEYSAETNQVLSAAHHFYSINDERMRDFLIEAASISMLRGQWITAVRYIEKEIEYAKTQNETWQEAYCRYLLSQAVNELGDFSRAVNEIETSIQLFQSIDDLGWVRISKRWSYLFKMKDESPEQAIKYIENDLEHYKNSNSLLEAEILVNLSFLYLHASRFRDGVEAGKKAYAIFSELGEEYGKYISLSNISACIGQIGQPDEQLEYAEEIIRISEQKNIPRLKLLGLNHLAKVQRLQGDPISAQHTLEECIKICKTLGSEYQELLDTLNLGNAIRDQKKYDEAEAIYNDVLQRSKELGYKRHQARALELLSHIYLQKDLFEKAVEYGNQALKLHIHFNEPIRIASTLDDLAYCYIKIGVQQRAAESYFDSGKNHELSEQLGDAAKAFSSAGDIFTQLKQYERAVSSLTRAIECSIRKNDPDISIEAFELLKEVEQSTELRDKYLNIIDQSIDRRGCSSFTRLIYNLFSYCKLASTQAEKETFKIGIKKIIEKSSDLQCTETQNALALSFERADEDLISESVFHELANKIADKSDHLYYRSLNDGLVVWTLGFNWSPPIIVQVENLSDYPIGRQVASSLALLIHTNKTKIENAIKQYGGNKEASFRISVITRNEFTNKIAADYKLPEPENDYISASISESSVPWGQPQPPTLLILDDDYSLKADWSINPFNKAFIWVVMNVYTALVSHCTHKNEHEIDDIEEKKKDFCKSVFGLI